MKAYVAANVMGVFAFDQTGNLLKYTLFPKDAGQIAGQLTGGTAKEELIRTLRESGYDVDSADDNLAQQKLRTEFRTLAQQVKWGSPADVQRLLNEVNILLTKQKLMVEKKDRILIQVIGIIDELDKDLNACSERMREWYGLYFPELAATLSSNEKFISLLAAHPDREAIRDKSVAALARRSAGMRFSDQDVAAVQHLSSALAELFAAKKRLGAYLEDLASDTMPNATALCGPFLAARLLAQAGGLDKMARLTSSTIQLLGAEKALFRHLRGQGKAPKFGLLFGHPLVQQAPRELKGKVARIVAAKISLGAKVDYFSKEDRSEQLKKEMEQQVAAVLGKKRADASPSVSV